jgi:hypothetical protein
MRVSETDSFIQEVTEEVRQDRMFRLWKNYGPYGIGAVAAVIAGTAVMNWMHQRAVEQARVTGGEFLASDISSVEQQQKLVDEVSGPARVVAELRLAAAKEESGDSEGAAKLYRSIADEPGVQPAFGQLARLEAVRVSAPTMDKAAAEAELAPLVAEGAPYRLMALELRAVIRMNAGKLDEAHADLKAILDDPTATPETSQRATALMLSSGGTPPAAAQ